MLRKAKNLRLEALKIIAHFAVAKIELVPFELPALEGLSFEQIARLYEQGRIVPKDLAAIGWNTRQIWGRLGRSGRKLPLRFDYRVTFENGETELFHPSTTLVPEVVHARSAEVSAVSPTARETAPETELKWGKRLPQKLLSKRKAENPSFQRAFARFSAMAASGVTAESLIADASSAIPPAAASLALSTQGDGKG